MKKIIIILLSFLFMINLKANTIKSIDMDVYIDSNGNANITEKWSANLNSGTEGYRPYSNLGNMTITDFSVTDESGREYDFINYWNTSASFSNKAYKCGYNKTYDGVELCFGISKYGDKEYTLKYKINNFVVKYTDTEGIYFDFVNFDYDIGNVKITLHSDINFSLDNSRIWAFGYEGSDTFEDGEIVLKTNGELYSYNYMTLLVRFEDNLFNTNNISDESFDDIYDEAFNDMDEGEYEYYSKDSDKYSSTFVPVIAGIVSVIFNPFFIAFIFIFFVIKSMKNHEFKTRYYFGESSNKLSPEKDINYYRDIPCKKNLELAYFVCKNYNIVSEIKLKKGLMGAIILKWIKNKYITVTKTKKGLFNIKDNNYALDFSNMEKADNEVEEELFEMMKSASGLNKLLEPKELERWSRNNYYKIDKWYSLVMDNIDEMLMNEGIITVEKKDDKTFSRKVKKINPSLKEEAIKLVGLKKFLLDFSIMPEREYKEVHVWEEYLIFANVLGIADKVNEQFSKIYPEFRNEASFDPDIATYVSIHLIEDTFRGYNSGVQAARSRDYSGGSSFGGGGGSSFSSGGSSSGGSSGGGFR